MKVLKLQLILTIILVTSQAFTNDSCVAESTVASFNLGFSGVAAGGELILANNLPSPRLLRLSTTNGESAGSVASRIAAAINDDDPFGWFEGVTFYAGDSNIYANGSSLEFIGGSQGSFVLCGTENGLGIPQAPFDTSCSHDATDNEVTVKWENQPGGYDTLYVRQNGLPFAELAGSETGMTFDLDDVFDSHDVNNIDYRVIGVVGDTPSNGGVIRLRGSAQEELVGLPFTAGLAPNWKSWSYPTISSSLICMEGDRSNYDGPKQYYKQILTPDEKPFYQIVKTTSGGVVGGVVRRVLGLSPGHTYKISVRVNSLAMDSAQGNWELSVHAAYNGIGGTPLTVDQLRGAAVLADGSTGSTAGRIAAYGPGNTTNAEWVVRATGDGGVGSEVGDITLPSGVDTITVWLKHSGENSTGVGLDWLRIEDVASP